MVAMRVNSHSEPYTGVMDMADISPGDWITTVEAAKILKVGSTQAVRNLMVRNPEDLPGINIGTEAQPRWMLKRADVERFQAKRQPPDEIIG